MRLRIVQKPVPWIRHGLIRPASFADSPSSFSSFLLPAHLQLQPWPSSSSRDFSRLPGKVESVVCPLDVKMFLRSEMKYTVVKRPQGVPEV